VLVAGREAKLAGQEVFVAGQEHLAAGQEVLAAGREAKLAGYRIPFPRWRVVSVEYVKTAPRRRNLEVECAVPLVGWSASSVRLGIGPAECVASLVRLRVPTMRLGVGLDRWSDARAKGTGGLHQWAGRRYPRPAAMSRERTGMLYCLKGTSMWSMGVESSKSLRAKFNKPLKCSIYG
jgi:hypothetical protein